MDDVQIESGTCPEHGPFEGKSFRIPMMDKRIGPHCPRCSEEEKAKRAEDEKARRAGAMRARVRRVTGAAGIPPRFAGRSFSNYRAETEAQAKALRVTQAYADRFESRLAHGGGLVLCGKPGTGKTHLATAIANHVMQAGRSAMFTTAIRAVRSVKDTYRRDSDVTEQQAINALTLPDLLIVDEIGVQFGSDTEKLILFEILNGRYEQVRPTILISNLMESELADYIGARNLDRMKEGGGAVLAFDWDSYRSRVHKDEMLPKNEVPSVDEEIEADLARARVD